MEGHGAERTATPVAALRRTIHPAVVAIAVVAVAAAVAVLAGCAAGPGSAGNGPREGPGTASTNNGGGKAPTIGERTTRSGPEGGTTTAAAREEAKGGCGPGAEVTSGAIADFAFEPTDEKLVGFADNVFVGRVVEVEDGLASGAAAPLARTVFAVEILENVKGRLHGTVRVAQDGGCVEYRADRDYPEDGIRKGERVRGLQLVNGDPLLEPGREYLLVTRRDGRGDRHQITTPGYGDLPVTDGSHREELVRRFERAEKNQEDPARRS